MHELLIVEDEALILINSVCFFEDEGFLVYQAANGKEALEILEKHPNILIAIVDLKMPVMSGDEFMDIASKKYPDLHYVLHTGSLNYELCNSPLVKKVPKEYVHYKPVDFASLKKSVDNIIKHYENKTQKK